MPSTCGRATSVRALLSCLLFFMGAALAQPYPAKPVRMVVGFPPGGGADLVGRLLAEQLGRQLGAQFVVVNTVGASGAIAAASVTKADADGHTLFLATTPLTLTPHLNNVAYDALKGFTPIARIAEGPFAVVVQAESPYLTTADVVAAARAKPGQLNYGSGGAASTSQFAGELLRSMAKVDIQNIAYTGLPAALAAVLGGQIQLAITDLPPALGLVRAGRLRILGMTSAERVAMLPDVPTVSESGVPGYQIAIWYGLLGPAGLPKNVSDRLEGAVAGIFRSPDKALVDQFAGLGVVPAALNSPEEFTRFLARDFEFWKKLTAEVGAKAR
jgi:tripartite-type tricarboxylate transporter receptor subunit TctC